MLHRIDDLLLDLGGQVGRWHLPPNVLQIEECSASQLLPQQALNCLGVEQPGITGGLRKVIRERYLNRRQRSL